MSEKFNNIDKLFGEELKDFSPELPVGAWENIAMELTKSSNTKAVFFSFWRIAASIALFLATAGIAGYLFFNQPSSIETVSENESNKSINENKTEQAVAESNNSVPNSNAQPSNKIANQENKTVVLKGTKKLFSNNEEKTHTENIIIAENTNDDITSSLNNSQTLSQAVSENNESISEIQRENILTEKAASNVIQNNNAQTQDNFVWGSEEKNNSLDNGKWLIGGQAGPQYSYRTVSSDRYASQALEANNETESGLVTFTGGVQVEYQTSKRLSIQSGIYYSKLGVEQEAVPNNIEKVSSQISGPLNPDNNARIDGNSKYLFPNSSVNIVAKSNSSSKMMDSYSEVAPLEGNPATNVPSWRNYEYIEIPFIARYALIDRKLNLNLIGGFSTNVLISNNIAVDEKTNYTNLETEGVNTVNYSSTLGLGFSYDLSSNLVMSLEPQFKYFLNNQLYDEYMNLHPYSMGVFSGIKYSF